MAEYHLKRCEESTGTAEEEDMLLNFIKKRKLCSELECVHCGDVESPDNSVSSVACVCSAGEDDESTGGVAESDVSPDLESESSDAEISMAINCSRIDHETCGDFKQSSLESTPHAASPQRNSASSTARRMPSEAEIEEFFAAADKYEQKQFAEKYNYDISKDVPLEGRYEWVPSHPHP